MSVEELIFSAPTRTENFDADRFFSSRCTDLAFPEVACIVEIGKDRQPFDRATAKVLIGVIGVVLRSAGCRLYDLADASAHRFAARADLHDSLAIFGKPAPGYRLRSLGNRKS